MKYRIIKQPKFQSNPTYIVREVLEDGTTHLIYHDAFLVRDSNYKWAAEKEFATVKEARDMIMAYDFWINQKSKVVEEIEL